MMKLHESIDKSHQKLYQDKEAKEPGFKRLEPHQKNLVLNASALPPYDTPASAPNEFYNSFLRSKHFVHSKSLELRIFSASYQIHRQELASFFVWKQNL
jgi:hypothetical protein